MTVVFVGLIFILSTMVSCSKRSDEISEVRPENTETTDLSNDDFTESDEDLLKVDYQQFYEELAPHGEWIEVTNEEIGTDFNKSSASGLKANRRISLSRLLGVNDAYADDADFGAFFVWKPAPGLSVGVSTGDAAPTPVTSASYVPYSNGQWVNTPQGWYFQAPTPYEEVVHHYGRWAYSPTEGWVWVPGRVWSPAWVDWRTDDDYVAWTPISPGIYITNNNTVIDPVVYDDNRYVIVEKRYFIEPEIYKYHVVKNKRKVIIHEMRKVDGVMVVDHRVINRGPEVSVIETAFGNPVPVIEINKINTIDAVNHNGTVINTYVPVFKEFKVVKEINVPVRKPVKYVSYEKVKEKSMPPGLQKKIDNSEVKSEQKSLGNDKEKRVPKMINDQNMDPRNKNKNKDQQYNDNSRGNKNNGNVKKNRNDDHGKGNNKSNGNKNNGKGNHGNGNKNVEMKSKNNDHGNQNRNKGNDRSDNHKRKGK